MPELPEVETIARSLASAIEGQRIERVEVLRPDLLREPAERFAGRVSGRRIESVGRRGKNLVLRLTGSAGRAARSSSEKGRPAILLVNLGMTGRFVLAPEEGAATPSGTGPSFPAPPPEPPTHPGVRLHLDGGMLVYDDIRRFGVLECLTPEAWEDREATLGPEPLDPELDPETFHERLAGSRSPVRSWLLDQRRIAGVGNIYANEALHRAGIHPARAAASLAPADAARLLEAIREVLREAIEARGTTLRDYRDLDGRRGGYALELRAYGRAGEPCPLCGGGIRRTVISNRSAFFCPECQPLEGTRSGTRRDGPDGDGSRTRGRRRAPRSLATWLLGAAGLASAAAAPIACRPAASLPAVERELDNGLRVVVLPRWASPTVALVLRYGVGSMHDPAEGAGLAHLLEHLLFKGTTTIGAEGRTNEYSSILRRAGARGLNAVTGAASTTYFVELPANQTELWFILEGDRMRNAVLRDFEEEREVVLEERNQRVETSPPALLRERLLASAFAGDPVGSPTIGTREGLASLDESTARDHLDRRYVPNNAVLAVVGDVDPDSIFRWARDYLEGVAPGGASPSRRVRDGPGPRRVELRAGGSARLRMGWKTPGPGSPDAPAVDAIQRLLTVGPRSRLQRDLVQGGIASSIVTAVEPADAPRRLFTIEAVPAPGVSLDTLEAALTREIERLRREPPADGEIEWVRAQARAGRAREETSNLGLALNLAEAELIEGGWDEIEARRERFFEVGAEEVREVASRLFDPVGAWVGRLEPAPPGAPSPVDSSSARIVTPPSLGDPPIPGPDLPPLRPVGRDAALAFEPPPLDFQPVIPEPREVAGVPVFHVRDRTIPLVWIHLRLRGGYVSFPRDLYGPATALPFLLHRGGTRDLPPDSVTDQLIRNAIDLRVSGSGSATSATMELLPEHLDAALTLWNGILLEPRFDRSVVEAWRRQELSAVAGSTDSPFDLAVVQLNHLLYGDHPIGWTLAPSDLEEEDFADERLRELHAAVVCRERLTIGIAGDVAWRRAQAALEGFLAEWPSCAGPPLSEPLPEPEARPGVHLVPLAIPQSSIAMGHPTALRQAESPEYFAARIGDRILGGAGITSRLSNRLRSSEGLAYSVASLWTTPLRARGVAGATLRTSAETTVPAIRATLAEVGRMAVEPPDPAELEAAVDAVINGFVFSIGTPADVVERAATDWERGVPLDWIERFARGVQGVGPEEVGAVFARHIHPDSMAIVVVGDPDRIGEGLAEIAEVRVVGRGGG